MKPKQMFQAEDGKLFPSEEECVKYEMDSAFLSQLGELTAMAFPSSNAQEGLRTPQKAREETAKWVVKYQDKIRELLIQYDAEKRGHQEMYPPEKEK